MQTRFRTLPWWFLAAIAAYVALHARAAVMPPLFDDWPVIEMSHAAFAQYGPAGGFWHIISEPIGGFWRPLHILLTAPVWGDSAVVVQILKLVAIVGMAFLFARLARQSGLPTGVSYAAGAALLLHQCMVWGGEIDRWGDVLMGFAVIGLLLSATQTNVGAISTKWYAWSAALCTILALGGKEAGVVLPIIPVAAAVLLAEDRTQRRRHIAAAAASVTVVLLYMAARHLMGLGLASADPSDAYYRMELGANIPRNVGLITFALLSPINTIRVVIDSNGWLAAGALFALVWGLILLWGLYVWIRRAGFRWSLTMAFLFVAVQGPSLLMQNISEQNIARSLPIGILLAGTAVWSLWTSGTNPRRTVIASLLIVTFSLHVESTWSKIDHLVNAAERGRSFRNAVLEMMPSPPHRPVTFAAEKSYHGYSVYVQPLWRSIPGDADSGLRLKYADSNYRGVVRLHNSLQDEAAAAGADFVLTRNNELWARDGRRVQILPLDPYVGRSMRR